MQRGKLPWVAVCLTAAVSAAPPAPDKPPADRLTLETYQLQEKHFPPQKADEAWCEIGGEKDAMAVLDLNVPLLKRLAVRSDDLLEVVLRMKLAKSSPKLDPQAKLCLHRMLRPAGSSRPEAGADYDPEPIVAVELASHVRGGWLRVPGLAAAAARWVAGTWADCGVLVRAAGGAALRLHGVTSPGSGYWGRNLPMLDVTIRRHDSRFLFDWPVKPRDGVYCVMKGGRLWYGGKRLRMWGVCRGASYNPEQAQRVKKMGFNAVRLWTTYPYSDESARRGVIDETKTDTLDKYVAEIKAQGMWIMYPGLMTKPCGLGQANKGLLADDSWLAGGEDWGEWKKAVTAKGAPLKLFHYFDERLTRIRRRHARNVLGHVNPYTKRRFAEEECVAMYEVWNENGFLKWNLERGFAKWPAYFRNKLQRQWNAWLAKRCADEAGLKAAWGRLAAGESVKAGTVGLAPLVHERKEYPEQRGRDFVRFLIETVERSNREFVAYCRSLAPEGVGVNVVPFSMDTQYRNNMPWMFANSRGEVVCFGMYYHTMQSALTKPPGMGGLDTNTVAGRASVLYEVNCGKPNPYRAEFPLRLAALASWLDWDGAFFHYFQEPLWYWKRLNPDEQYLLEALPYKYNSADVHFETDATMCSSMAAAGQVFLRGLLPPAPKPVIYRVGGRAIFGYDKFGGVWMKPKTFTEGAFAEFHPDEDGGITVNGRQPPADGRIDAAVASGEHVLWDWPNGRLIIDAPTCKVYVGKPAPVRFRDGIALSGIDTKFAYFAMVSDDGKPLAGPDAARRIHITAGWNNLNTGYEIDPKMLRKKGFAHPGERMNAVRKKGHPPVLADAVPYTVHFPTEIDYRFEGYDFALRKCRESAAKATNSVRHDGREEFMGVLHVTRRGRPARVPVTAEPAWPKSVRTAAAAPTAAPAAAAGGKLFHPVAGLDWDMDYRAARKALAAAKFPYASLSKPEPPTKARRTIVVSGAKALFDSPAEIEIAFRGEAMRRVAVSFSQAPPLSEVLAAYEKRLGRPASKKLASQVYGTSRIRWEARRGGRTLGVEVTDHQGSLAITFERR